MYTPALSTTVYCLLEPIETSVIGKRAVWNGYINYGNAPVSHDQPPEYLLIANEASRQELHDAFHVESTGALACDRAVIRRVFRVWSLQRSLRRWHQDLNVVHYNKD